MLSSRRSSFSASTIAVAVVATTVLVAIVPPPTFLSSSSSSFVLFVSAEMTREECLDVGGSIVGDIGNGAIFRSDYVCPSTGVPPLDIVIASPGEPIASEGEVCCELINMDNSNTSNNGLDGDGGDMTTIDRESISRDECRRQDGEIVGDIGDGATQRDDYVCPSAGEPPFANVFAGPDEPIAIEGEVCCKVASDSDSSNGLGGTGDELGAEIINDREQISRDECLERNGVVVGDIGDGATKRDDYVCPSTGEPPMADVIASPGEPIAFEGEVCCGTGAPSQVEDVTVPDSSQEDEDDAEMTTALNDGGNSAAIATRHTGVVAIVSSMMLILFM